MTAAELLSRLQYRDSPNFFNVDAESGFDDAADFAHTFRRAGKDLGLKGVYTLRQGINDARDNIIPIVYVCEVDSDAKASEIHRQVWNQNTVPFLIVVSPETIRLYSGFHYETPSETIGAGGFLRVAHEMSEALDVLSAFHSERIDDGSVWAQWGDQVTPETRVDWRLLSHLNDLDTWLRNNGLDAPEVSHALIGKYVYLRYLRDRDILSDRRLAEWDLTKDQLFGRNATLKAFWRVVDELDVWLNGSMFPLDKQGENRPRQEHLRKVAGTFAGDEPQSNQLTLDFDIYDFSFIPIETLSVIYEQFLHAPTADGSTTKGKAQGAYYTPIPVVNFMLEELDSLHPFNNGMKVLDPACGSGAFLVQCYRRIIEQDEEFEAGKAMRPARLRELLEEHIFGIDRDLDACRVAELSLSLTLLDYVDPPDLMRYSTFQLPSLHNKNVYHGDFFDPNAEWREALADVRFDWIVGNPPWVELKSGSVSTDDQHAWRWLQDPANRKAKPTGGNQVSEAFVWEVVTWAEKDGKIALLLPAMTLFKNESEEFRSRLVGEHNLDCIANFANFAEVLFPGHRYRNGKRVSTKRPRRAAVAIFYSNEACTGSLFPVYSPMVADQDSSRSHKPNKQKDAWNIAIDSSRIVHLDPRDIADGDSLHWKAAMWGSHHDVRLLNRLERAFAKESFSDLRATAKLTVSQGLELRKKDSSEEVEAVPEIAGELKLEMTKLKTCGRIFTVPEIALSKIDESEAYVRKGRVRLPLAVSKPPHVIVDRARRFAVYDDRFIAVPPRQIGIAGEESQASLLQALSLYIVSDFSIYHQFFLTPEWGISTSTSTLDALKRLPIPISTLTANELEEWADLHEALRKCEVASRDNIPLLDDYVDPTPFLRELNERVYELLGLASHERCLVSDLVHVRLQLLQGKVSADAIRSPKPEELLSYSRMLRDELDAFVDDQPRLKHQITVSKNGQSAVVAIKLHTNAKRNHQPKITDVDDATSREFAKIRQDVRKQHSQWFYFNRNLRLYRGNTTYIFKPLSRLHWTGSQAMKDASTIIAETLS